MMQSIEQIWLNALDSKEKFPLDFDDLWQVSGYQRKDHALRFFKSLTSLQLNIHFSPRMGKSSTGGRSSDSFGLTVEAFKFFLAKSNTKQGDDLLWYLIEVEKKHRENLERQFQVSLTIPAIPDISSTLVVDNSAEISELHQKIEKLEQNLADQRKQLHDYQAKTQKKIDNLQANLEWHKQHPEMTLQEHINEVMCYFVNLVSDPKDSKKLQEFLDFAKTYKYPGEGLIRFNPNNPGESLAEDAWYSRFLRAKAGVARKLIKIFQKTAVEECLQAACYGLEGSYTERGKKAYEKEVLIYRHLLHALDTDLN